QQSSQRGRVAFFDGISYSAFSCTQCQAGDAGNQDRHGENNQSSFHGRRSPQSPLQFRKTIGTVALFVLVNPVHIENAQQQVSCCDGAPVVLQEPSAFQLSTQTADHDVGHIEMLVL